MDVETHNYRQIEQLNQRGGRTLSIVDLIQAGTLSVEMAACGARAMHRGASILTGARPGGAGKTTLMAAMLGFLPAGVPLVTVDNAEVITRASASGGDGPACYLAHEIGSGHWFGYIWGRDVARFLDLIGGGRRVASCLHADTLEETAEILAAAPLGADRQALGRVELVLFMHVDGGFRNARRRVAAFHEADGSGSHRQLFAWDPVEDRFTRLSPPSDPQGLAPYVALIERLVDEGDVEVEAVRRKVLQWQAAR